MRKIDKYDFKLLLNFSEINKAKEKLKEKRKR